MRFIVKLKEANMSGVAWVFQAVHDNTVVLEYVGAPFNRQQVSQLMTCWTDAFTNFILCFMKYEDRDLDAIVRALILPEPNYQNAGAYHAELTICVDRYTMPYWSLKVRDEDGKVECEFVSKTFNPRNRKDFREWAQYCVRDFVNYITSPGSNVDTTTAAMLKRANVSEERKQIITPGQYDLGIKFKPNQL